MSEVKENQLIHDDTTEIIAGIDESVLNHNYDGIMELDNDLPGWWQGLFGITVIIAVIYLAGYHVFHAWDLQTAEYKRAMGWIGKPAETQTVKKAEVEKPLVAFKDAASITAGKAVFDAKCFVCHGSKGEGLVGPNLTDKFWVTGGSFKEIVHTITEGGRPNKGMQAWKTMIGKTQIQQVASYIVSLQGTNPKNAKKPEGVPYEGGY